MKLLSNKEIDIVSGEMMIWLFRRLGYTNNTTTPRNLSSAMAVLALATTKIFFSLRQQMAKGDVLTLFHSWTSMIHQDITEEDALFDSAKKAAEKYSSLDEAEAYISKMKGN